MSACFWAHVSHAVYGTLITLRPQTVHNPVIELRQARKGKKPKPQHARKLLFSLNKSDIQSKQH